MIPRATQLHIACAYIRAWTSYTAAAVFSWVHTLDPVMSERCNGVQRFSSGVKTPSLPVARELDFSRSVVVNGRRRGRGDVVSFYGPR